MRDFMKLREFLKMGDFQKMRDFEKLWKVNDEKIELLLRSARLSLGLKMNKIIHIVCTEKVIINEIVCDVMNHSFHPKIVHEQGLSPYHLARPRQHTRALS